MKILQICFDLSCGGAERFVVDLSNELANTHEVTLLALKEMNGNLKRSHYRGEVSRNVNFYCLGLKNGFHPSSVFKVAWFIRKCRPDIVHFHGDRMPFWMSFSLLTAKGAVKFVQTIHNDIHNGYDTLAYRIYYRLSKLRNNLAFVALSPTNYKDLLAISPGIHAAQILNGRSRISPSASFKDVEKEIEDLKSNKDTLIFIHVARCHKDKAQLRLVKSFNEFSKRGRNAKLLILGNNYFDTPLGDNLREISCPEVHYLGVRKNIGDYFLCSDAFCLSSDYEGMPITVLESLLSGCPVLSTPVCGIVDVIEDGVNGIIAEDFSDSSYLSAMERLYASILSLKQSTAAFRDNHSLTIEGCASSYIEFYNSLLRDTNNNK